MSLFLSFWCFLRNFVCWWVQEALLTLVCVCACVVWVALEVRSCVEGISASKLILYGSLVGRILMLESNSLVGGLSLVGGQVRL